MSDNDDVQKINLLGEELPVRVADSEHAREAYKMVQEKIDSIRDQSNSPTNLQLALLCSLNIAGELIQSREDTEDQRLPDQLRSRVVELTGEIEQTLSN